MHPNDSTSALAVVRNEKGNTLEVLRINQFESRFQSMSVLVRDEIGKIYVFIKGAPERINYNSIKKPKNFTATVEALSLSGFRTIAIGYKVIDPSELEKYMRAER